MTLKLPALDEVLAVTAERLTAMTPVQIDYMNARLSEEHYRLLEEDGRRFERLCTALGEEKVQRGRRQVWPLSPDEARRKAARLVAEPPAAVPPYIQRYDFLATVETYVSRIGRALDALNALDTERERMRPAQNLLWGEFRRRGGWSRFFLVMNDNGHIHSTDSPGMCGSLRPTTRINWLPDLSGMTVEEAVTKFEHNLCSRCFPGAPVEYRERQRPAEADDRCKGSGSYVELTAEQARRVSKFAACPECGRKVAVTSTWKIRKHPPK
ncbi:hypothetical protein [Streptomyces albidoflavus]|uniref:hypothetical protein n=1 Tax=Streptomyces albidoflavus TaxID=1886 RepID=UPI0033D463F0